MADHPYPGSIPPPPGVTPNLENPPDAGRALNIGIMITCDVLVLMFFTMRVVAKTRITRQILLEDGWFCDAGS